MFDHVKRRKQEIEGVIENLTYLIDNAHDNRCSDRDNVAMSYFDQLCAFDKDDYGRAYDMVFNASDDGTIPDATVVELAKCRAALRYVVTGYCGADFDHFIMWRALYKLFEVDALWDEAERYMPTYDGSIDAPDDGDWREWLGKVEY